MKKTTYIEVLISILLVIAICLSVIYILVQESRGFIYHSFLVSNLLILILFVLLLIFPKERIKFKINITDKITTFLTNISLAIPFVFTLLSWGAATNQKTNEAPVSFLKVIEDYGSLYYVAFLFFLLNAIFIVIKPCLMAFYNKKVINMNIDNSVQYVINGFNFTANKTGDGITVKLTGKTTTGKNIDYSVTKNSASDLINDIDNNYPEIKFEVLKKLLDAIKILE